MSIISNTKPTFLLSLIKLVISDALIIGSGIWPANNMVALEYLLIISRIKFNAHARYQFYAHTKLTRVKLSY